MLVSAEVMHRVLWQLQDWETPLSPLTPEALSFWIILARAFHERLIPVPHPDLCVSKIQYSLVKAHLISDQAFHAIVREP